MSVQLEEGLAKDATKSLSIGLVSKLPLILEPVSLCRMQGPYLWNSPIAKSMKKGVAEEKNV